MRPSDPSHISGPALRAEPETQRGAYEEDVAVVFDQVVGDERPKARFAHVEVVAREESHESLVFAAAQLALDRGASPELPAILGMEHEQHPKGLEVEVAEGP